MEVDGYRIREKKIALPKDGTIPSFPETVGQEEQQTLLAWISCLWQSVEVVSAVQQRRICCGPMPTGAEAFLGWKRWILSHHFFIPLLAWSATRSRRRPNRCRPASARMGASPWSGRTDAARLCHYSCSASTFTPDLRSVAVTSAIHRCAYPDSTSDDSNLIASMLRAAIAMVVAVMPIHMLCADASR